MKEALLVIDVQNEYFTGRLPVTHPEGSLDNILKAMDWAHDGRVPVIVHVGAPATSVSQRLARYAREAGADAIQWPQPNAGGQSELACVGGAVTEAELTALAAGAGLEAGRVVRRFDCFRNTRLAHKFHGRLDVHAVAFHAVKPPSAAR